MTAARPAATAIAGVPPGRGGDEAARVGCRGAGDESGGEPQAEAGGRPGPEDRGHPQDRGQPPGDQREVERQAPVQPVGRRGH